MLALAAPASLLVLPATRGSVSCRPESGAVSSILPPRDTICRIVPEAQHVLAQPRMSDNGITEIPGTRSRPCQLGPALMTLW